MTNNRKQRTYPPRVVVSNTKSPKIDKTKYLQIISELGGDIPKLQEFINSKLADAVQCSGGESGAIGRQTVRDFWNAKRPRPNQWLIILEWYRQYLFTQNNR